ncbi:HK97 gp10 family phage protein [Rhodococcus erythropolis]
MASVTITVDSAQVRKMLEIAPERVRTRLKRVLNVVAVETQREMRIKAQVGVSGDLRQSIKQEVTGTTAIVGPTAKYAEAVENGSRPHWTSVKPDTSLYKWAKAKGISPYAVQRSIAYKGTKAHPFVAPTVTLMEPRIQRRFDTEIEKLTEELMNG